MVHRYLTKRVYEARISGNGIACKALDIDVAVET